VTDADGNALGRQTLGYCVFSTMLIVLTCQITIHSNIFNKLHLWFTFIIPLSSFWGGMYIYNIMMNTLEVRRLH
jgi:hypothetical protein